MELNVGALNLVRAKLRVQFLDLGRQIGLQFFAILLRQQVELGVYLAGDGEISEKNLPVGQIQFVDSQLQ